MKETREGNSNRELVRESGAAAFEGSGREWIITVSLSPELALRLRNAVGDRDTTIGLAMEEAIKLWLDRPEP